MSKVFELVTHASIETRAAGRTLAALLEPGDVVLLAGQLGAGKTEFAKGIAEGLGVEDTVVSPTFTIVREYQGRDARPEGGLRMLHVDVYRLDHAQELLDLGLEDLAADEAVTVVEWGDAVAGLFPADHLEVLILLPDGLPDQDDNLLEQQRILRFTMAGPSWAARAAAIAVVVNPGTS